MESNPRCLQPRKGGGGNSVRWPAICGHSELGETIEAIDHHFDLTAHA